MCKIVMEDKLVWNIAMDESQWPPGVWRNDECAESVNKLLMSDSCIAVV